MKINPSYGAMRADFFRYCVLYLYGGIYLDIKSKLTYPLFKLIKKDDICILDIPRNNLEPWRKNEPTYEQWLLIFAPRHPYLLAVINQIYQYINDNYIPTTINNISLSTKGKILNITGPDSFTKAINNFISSNKPLHRNLDYCKFSDLNCHINYRKMYKINNKRHYSELNEPLFI
jgi:mannosyltransferase OCH1-like enzyme